MRPVRVPPALLLLALVVLAYWPIVGCGYVWDDDSYVTQNPVLRSLGGIVRIWFEPTSLPQYYPLVHTTFWLEYRLWGDHPLGYHLINALLHFGSCLLLLRLLRRLELPGALLAAAVLVHPVHVESVAWVTERKNVLSLFFMLLAALQWQRWQQHGDRRTWWLATTSFLAALLAKTVTATLPAALLVVQWWRHGRLSRREVLGVVLWLVLGLGFGLFTAWLEATHVGAAGAQWQLIGAERLLVAGRAVWFYLATLLWPVGLCFNYPRWPLDSGAWLQWLPTLSALLAAVLAIALRQRLGRGPAAALLLFGGMLVPALGFFDVYPFRFSYVADHFQYHASVAMLAALAAGVTLACRRVPANVSRAVAVGLVLLLAASTNMLTRNYRDLETCWRATLACNPDSMLSLINLGGLLLQRGDLEAAEQCFDDCLRRHPDNYESLGNLGQIAHRRKDLPKARQFYAASLAQREDNAAVLHNLAVLEEQEGHTGKALPIARRCVELSPEMYEGRSTLARVAFAEGSWQECVAQADWILKRTPGATAVRLLAARALLELGQNDGAMQNAGVVLRTTPGLPLARETFARAIARGLRTQPIDGLAGKVDSVCRSGGLDPAPLLPLIVVELRSLGDNARAAALQR